MRTLKKIPLTAYDPPLRRKKDTFVLDALETAWIILAFHTPLRTQRSLIRWMWPRIVLYLFDTHLAQCYGACYVFPAGFGIENCVMCTTYGPILAHTPAPTNRAFSWFGYWIGDAQAKRKWRDRSPSPGPRWDVWEMQ